ncbi:uncharacterized protein LACBIDRAFT_310621 [Laccaria bicolor S238N-H82]|uniref:Predicted protein n=1 Tax=Laccaria bicolor (strain S238N-H82 / ATCC MYA-4686) TaxID=486041 RepID=B0DUQ9_LACBS|nr:uncharacterized protein LACBIDRAFT_310621 [Laccaria bicolor S238N-H82]EDR01586.1 predicted protein [Laccaria bicolor S238N-H82]|eukprot:XP_001887662.1 predicted protein [Laccaria bicolor S238N-H82]
MQASVTPEVSWVTALSSGAIVSFVFALPSFGQHDTRHVDCDSPANKSMVSGIVGPSLHLSL